LRLPLLRACAQRRFIGGGVMKRENGIEK